MTNQNDYVVIKKTSREKLIKELKEVKKENQQLKKQKDDVIEYIKKLKTFDYFRDNKNLVELLRMLGEINE